MVHFHFKNSHYQQVSFSHHIHIHVNHINNYSGTFPTRKSHYQLEWYITTKITLPARVVHYQQDHITSQSGTFPLRKSYYQQMLLSHHIHVNHINSYSGTFPTRKSHYQLEWYITNKITIPARVVHYQQDHITS